jgi:hypothetical protein
MIRIVTFGALKIWLFIQQTHSYQNGDVKNLPEIQEFICYFKFSEPTVIVYGELIRENDSRHPKIFTSIEEAELYATGYLEKRFHFKK